MCMATEQPTKPFPRISGLLHSAFSKSKGLRAGLFARKAIVVYEVKRVEPASEAPRNVGGPELAKVA